MRVTSSPWHDLEKRISYAFRDQGLLKRALTHRSAGEENFERLEFLGDSILNYLVSRELYDHQPGAAEGDLSRLRAALVKKETLAQLARAIGLGEFLLLGQGERKSGGQRRESILADGMEALIGAVLLDGGWTACQALVLQLYDGRFSFSAPQSKVAEKDPKTRLQEYLQKLKKPLPVYEIVEVTGKDHAQIFQVLCRCELTDYAAPGGGPSRRIAEQEAADAMLRWLTK